MDCGNDVSEEHPPKNNSSKLLNFPIDFGNDVNSEHMLRSRLFRFRRFLIYSGSDVISDPLKLNLRKFVRLPIDSGKFIA